jgi:anti-sigma B factor antagonist
VAEQIEVAVDAADGATVATVRGEVDLSTASHLQSGLRTAAVGAALLVVDLSGVEYLDSAGLAVLDTSAREMHAQGGALRLVVSEDSIVTRALRISGLSETIPTFYGFDDAIAAGGSTAPQ